MSSPVPLLPKPSHAPAPRRSSENWLIASTVFVTFIGYFTVALPLAVVPVYVHATLGYGATVAGIAVSLQYLATVSSRARVGQMTDTLGAKVTVARGLVAAVLGGLLMLGSATLAARPALSLAALLPSRLALGVGESLISTGAIAWAIAHVGPQRTARIISWNGIATYSALVIGAPLGVVLTRLLGFRIVGIGDAAMGLAGLALVLSRAPTPVIARARLSSGSVLRRVLPYGSVLALASAGFGTITTFAALFFTHRGWNGAAWCISAFGVGFILVRLCFAESINRYGGVAVAGVSLVAQMLGLLLVWAAGHPSLAMAGSALTGLGYALVFPALAVEAMARVPAQSRGAAIGLYSVFLDIGLGVTGPAAGIIAGRFGYGAPFLCGALATLTGLGIVTLLRRAPPPVP